MEEGRKARGGVFSGNALKIIAIVTMFIDHIGAAILEPGPLKGLLATGDFAPILGDPGLLRVFQADLVLRMIGRLAFPIFCFLLVEGFLHTRDVKKYLLRLLAFCLISEVPFDLAFSGAWFAPGYQNVYFTLFLGLLALAGLARFQGSWGPSALVLLGCALGAEFLCADYGAFGVIFIVLLYLLREKKVLQTVLGCVALSWEITAPLAFLPIRLYSGERGRWNLKYLFYAFYPAHILLLWGVRLLLFP